MTVKDFQDKWFSLMESRTGYANPTATTMLFAVSRLSLKQQTPNILLDWHEIALATGIANYKTFKKNLDYLCSLGALSVVKKGYNDQMPTVIYVRILAENDAVMSELWSKTDSEIRQLALSKNTKAVPKLYQSTDKAMEKLYQSSTKAVPKLYQSTLTHVHGRGRAEKEYTSGVVEYNTSSKEKEVVSSSCSSSNATGENFNNSGGGDSNDVPDFVRRDRQAAPELRAQLTKGQSHYADRHPPVETGTAAIAEEWCSIGNAPFTRPAAEEYIRQLFAGTKGEPMQKRTHLTIDQILPAFMEKRALNGEFANKRHLFACVEGFAEDVRDGKETANSAAVKPKKSPSPIDNLVWN